MPADLATQIREAREAAGLTQQTLAATLGVSQAAVSAWERGIQVPRTLGVWHGLSVALGVAVLIDSHGARLVDLHAK